VYTTVRVLWDADFRCFWVTFVFGNISLRRKKLKTFKKFFKKPSFSAPIAVDRRGHIASYNNQRQAQYLYNVHLRLCPHKTTYSGKFRSTALRLGCVTVPAHSIYTTWFSGPTGFSGSLKRFIASPAYRAVSFHDDLHVAGRRKVDLQTTHTRTSAPD